MKLFAKDAVLGDEKIYCFEKDINLLYSIDISTGKIELIDSIPEEQICKRDLCGYLYIWNEKIITAPFSAEKIWIYDLKKKEWNNIELQNEGQFKAGIHLIAEYDGRVFLIGATYPAIICIDRSIHNIIYIKAPFLDMKKRNLFFKDAFFRAEYLKKGKSLFLASCLDNYVLEFDMQSFNYKWHKVGSERNKYSGIISDGNACWLSPRTNTPIIKWNGIHEVKEFELPEGVCEDHENCFLGIFYSDKELIIPNQIRSKSININFRTDEIKVVDQRYCFYKNIETGGSIYQTYDGKFHIHIGTNQNYVYDLNYTYRELRDFYQKKFYDYEEKNIDFLLKYKDELEDYIEIIMEKDSYKKLAGKINTGISVWELIKS